MISPSLNPLDQQFLIDLNRISDRMQQAQRRISTGVRLSFRLLTLSNKSASFDSHRRSCVNRKKVRSMLRKLLKLRGLSVTVSKKL